MTRSSALEGWGIRTVPAGLAQRYRDEGWWTEDSLGAMVADGLGRAPHLPFHVRSKARPYTGTLAEVDRAARSLAWALRVRDIGPGSVVMLQLPNWVEAAVTFWAATYVGAVVVPVVHFYGPKEVGYILDDTRPAVIVTPDRFGRTDHLQQYEQLLAGRDEEPLWLVVSDRPERELPRAATPFHRMLDADPLTGPEAVDPTAPAIVGFTSGTTLNPKGVVHSHQTIGWEARQADHFYGKGGPPQLVGTPVGHFMGMINAFLLPLLRSEPVQLIDVWDPAEVLRAMSERGLGIAGGPPYFLTSLLDHPDFTPEHLAQIPYMGLGGATVPEAFTERATKEGIAVYRSYGSTEHPSITASLLDDAADKRLRTDGRALPGAEFRLDGNGEILSRGADCCIGYTDPALTARAFDADGWYRTGDMGEVDGDGYLTITDRVADVIIRGGENISAQEVESLLLRMEQVAEVSVVAEPDPRLGEHATAVIRPHEAAGPVSLEDVRAHLAAAGLARQKWPESVHLVEDFPRTATGKIQKFRLRQQVRDGSLRETR
ncbi:Acyl-CoA synthetase (AMP-forming)/AMP-acid ligase II [Thermomonospora echinospora]|uniref:Acyl-CoA synthetase (AMP-forming)/AMP-acid ligase II n=1 Tax=Thermomonospora echinospora TaxID=1992 RepID=A0A1H6E7X2_9ACTN|nr:AMP-binding protein [Thermomonospora echinospora]SEG92955.1 Acyl-CoA synthetase (AMP-forming)/AMP-acid ligase II [Thermomonospora echinospora]